MRKENPNNCLFGRKGAWGTWPEVVLGSDATSDPNWNSSCFFKQVPPAHTFSPISVLWGPWTSRSLNLPLRSLRLWFHQKPEASPTGWTQSWGRNPDRLTILPLRFFIPHWGMQIFLKLILKHAWKTYHLYVSTLVFQKRISNLRLAKPLTFISPPRGNLRWWD